MDINAVSGIIYHGNDGYLVYWDTGRECINMCIRKKMRIFYQECAICTFTLANVHNMYF